MKLKPKYTTDGLLIVQRVQFPIGDYLFFGYSAGEIDPKTGLVINYLSGGQLAESIGNNESTTRSNRLPNKLKSLPGSDFTTRSGLYYTDDKEPIKLNLWTTVQSHRYWNYHSCFNQNEKAFLIVDALGSTSLDIIINDAFGRGYQSGDAQEMVNQRIYAMRDWVKTNYTDFSNWLLPSTIKEAGFSDGDEISYMQNEAYLAEKASRLEKLVRTRKRRFTGEKKIKVGELTNSVKIGLKFRRDYENDFGGKCNSTDYLNLVNKSTKLL